MPTVSHSSPLILYARIGRPDILHAVFGYPDVPPAVAAECGFGPGVKPHQDFAGTLDWIRVRPVVDAERVRVCRRRVDAGEAEAFALALEAASPVTMVLDDKRGRRVASDVGLTAVGSAGVRLRAKRHWTRVPFQGLQSPDEP